MQCIPVSLLMLLLVSFLLMTTLPPVCSAHQTFRTSRRRAIPTDNAITGNRFQLAKTPCVGDTTTSSDCQKNPPLQMTQGIEKRHGRVKASATAAVNQLRDTSEERHLRTLQIHENNDDDHSTDDLAPELRSELIAKLMDAEEEQRRAETALRESMRRRNNKPFDRRLHVKGPSFGNRVAAHAKPARSPGDVNQPVNVTLYFETMCSDSRDMILKSVFPAYQKLARSGIMNLRLVPYGKAEESRVGTEFHFSCQHGAQECYGNRIATCAIQDMKDPSVWLPFISCLIKHDINDWSAKFCASTQFVPYRPIRLCAIGMEGASLMHEMGRLTRELAGYLSYVPWFVMDGADGSEVQSGLTNNMVAYVCNAYRGRKPAECNM